jgi:serine/threonine protein kinase
MLNGATTESNPGIPRKLGRYEILGELGHGGMGRVYKGFDPTIGRTVAIKTVLYRGDADLLKILQREARAAGRLNHPNCVTIHDAGEDQGLFYIAMEFVEGETLEHRMASGSLSLELAASIAEQVSAALDNAHAHPAGMVVHRDIKPANIMISPTGVKVMDFGIARVQSFSYTPYTAGAVAGTPQYMAPEAWQGKPLDGRADIFSLGVTIYAALTGQLPFSGDTALAVMYKIMGEEPAVPSRINLSLGKEVDAVLLKALAKNREERYQRCSDFSRDLKESLAAQARPAARLDTGNGDLESTAQWPARTESTPTEGTQPTAKLLRRPWFVGIALAGVLLAALVTLRWMERPRTKSAPKTNGERETAKQEQPFPAGTPVKPAPAKPAPQSRDEPKSSDARSTVPPPIVPPSIVPPHPQSRDEPKPSDAVAPPASPLATLLVTADLACDWKLDWEPQGRLEAGSSARVAVGFGKHKIEAVTADGLDSWANVVEATKPQQEVVSVELAPVRAQRLRQDQEAADKRRQQEAAAAERQRQQPAVEERRRQAAEAERLRIQEAARPVWTDESTHLMWARKGNGSGVNWNQAKSYCRQLRLGGYSDWRLPAIDELSALYDRNKSDTLVDAAGNPHAYHIEGSIKLGISTPPTQVWSGTPSDSRSAWSVRFADGLRLATDSDNPNYYIGALCVRRAAD